MAIRRLAGGVILTLALSIANAAAEPPTTAVIGTPPQPSWQQLTPQQKTALAPLAKEWDKLENIRKRKWLGIAERYPGMSADQQARMQERMREWATLTPEQRSKARDTYKDFTQLPAEQKRVVREKWEAYSNLPSDEKQRVRETSKSSRLLTPPAPPASASETAADATETPATPAPTSPAEAPAKR